MQQTQISTVITPRAHAHWALILRLQVNALPKILQYRYRFYWMRILKIAKFKTLKGCKHVDLCCLSTSLTHPSRPKIYRNLASVMYMYSLVWWFYQVTTRPALSFHFLCSVSRPLESSTLRMWVLLLCCLWSLGNCVLRSDKRSYVYHLSGLGQICVSWRTLRHIIVWTSNYKSSCPEHFRALIFETYIGKSWTNT